MQKTTAVKEQQMHSRKVSRQVFELIFSLLEAHFNTGKLMLSADGRMRQ
jgi:hypothetical protein